MGFTPICTEINLKSDPIFSFKKYFIKVKKKKNDLQNKKKT